MLTEIRRLLHIALPLIAAYLAELAMFLTTKIVVGGLGYRELAAVGLAGHIAFELLVVSMGLLSVVGVLAAQAEGGGRRRDAGHATRQGFVVATAIGVPATAAVWHLDRVLAAAGQDPAVVALVAPYLPAVSGMVLPMLWFTVLRNFVAALSRTAVVMIITLAAVGLNYLLCNALVYGLAGLPALGVAGAGAALSIVTWLMFAALLAYVFYTPALRGYGIFRGRLRIDGAVCAEIVRLGLPVAGIVTLEAGLFIAVGLLSGLFGAKSLAAFDILMNWVGLPFVVALGLAEATMVRVAHGVGRGDRRGARRAGFVGLALGVAVLTAMIVIPLTAADAVVGLFLDRDDPGYLEVGALVAQLIVIVALFQVFDGVQAIASRALRAIKDTVVPMWLAAFGYWVIGIGGGSLLAFPLGLGVDGLWWGLAVALMVTALLLLWRFDRLTKTRPAAARSQSSPARR